MTALFVPAKTPFYNSCFIFVIIIFLIFNLLLLFHNFILNNFVVDVLIFIKNTENENENTN